MSLKDYLLKRIKEDGYLNFSELESICKGNNKENKFYKTSTAERAIRELRDKDGYKENIDLIMEKNYIVSYKWKNNPVQSKLLDIEPTKKLSYEYER